MYVGQIKLFLVGFQYRRELDLHPCPKLLIFHSLVLSFSMKETSINYLSDVRCITRGPNAKRSVLWKQSNRRIPWLALSNAVRTLMASPLSSLSSILSQPHCAIRIRLPTRCCFGLQSLSPKPHLSSSRCNLRTPPPFRPGFSLTFSRKFSQSHSHLPLSNKSEVPSLHSFIAQAAVATSEVQPEWVNYYTYIYAFCWIIEKQCDKTWILGFF